MCGLDGLNSLNDVRSSYAENQYGWLFYALARTHQPRFCIELGVLDGYSLICTAMALRDNGIGRILAYDLWEDYPFKHGAMADVQKRVDALGLGPFVILGKANAYDVPPYCSDGVVDWIHVDVSNTGDIVEWALREWQPKLKTGGLLLIEGGSKQRDEVDWMIKYHKEPIAPVLNDWRDEYEIITLEPYPSLTLCKKRGAT